MAASSRCAPRDSLPTAARPHSTKIGHERLPEPSEKRRCRLAAIQSGITTSLPDPSEWGQVHASTQSIRQRRLCVPRIELSRGTRSSFSKASRVFPARRNEKGSGGSGVFDRSGPEGTSPSLLATPVGAISPILCSPFVARIGYHTHESGVVGGRTQSALKHQEGILHGH
jgi:hypothetical protein